MTLFRLIAPLSCVAVAMSVQAGVAGDEKIISSHGYAILGDLTLPADFAHLPFVNPEAPKGGYIIEAVPNSSNFDNFNPYTIKGRAAVFSSAMLESMFTGDPSDFGAHYCLLCETIEYPESRDWVIFNLRPQARFADGSAVTAADVVFSVEALRDQAANATKLLIQQQIASVEALDEQRVKFTFTEGYPRREVISFAGQLPVMSKADFEARGLRLDETMDKPLMGSGPYALTGWSMGRWAEVTRRPDYWGADLPVNIGQNNFDRMRYEYFADYDAAFQAFTAGEYTFRREVSSIKWATAYDFPALEKGWVEKVTLPDNSSVSGQAWVFNLRRPQFADPRVREAIGLMFNFKWTNEKQFYGLYERVNSFWENSDLEATGLPSEAELALLEPLRADLPESVFTEPAFVWPEGSDAQMDRGNRSKVEKLLDEAGWQIPLPQKHARIGAIPTGLGLVILLALGGGAAFLSSRSPKTRHSIIVTTLVLAAGFLLFSRSEVTQRSDGLRRNADGEILRVEIMNDSATFDRIINPFVENLRAIGIDAVNARIDNAEATARERAHDFDITSTWLGQSPIPGAEMLPDFSSEYADNESNFLGLKNPAIDALMKHVEHAETRDEMVTAVHALDRSLRAMRLWVPQWYNANHLLAYYDMYGHPDTLPDYALGQMSFWWFDADKAAHLQAEGAVR